MAEDAGKKVPPTPDLNSPGVEIGSANAPFIFFDAVSGFGAYNGIAHMTLEAMRFMDVGGKLRTDQVVVAHLRMNLVALQALKKTIGDIELLMQPVPDATKN